MVLKVISLNSRRYPFTRDPELEILNFGAIDDEPDEGVVPKSCLQVIYVKGARRIDFCDRGSAKSRMKFKNQLFNF